MCILTKKHIFKRILENKPIELWLPTTEANDPVNAASHELLIETDVYVHYAHDAQSDICLRVTHPIRAYWPRTSRNHFPGDEYCVVVDKDNNMTNWNIRDMKIGETIPLDVDIK
jgi:hypothetical protein